MSAQVPNIEAQLNEVEFLRSLYDSVRVSPHSVLDEFQAFVDGKLDDVYNQISLLVTLADVKPPAEIEITLPHNYPNESLRLLTSVRNHSYLNRGLQDLVSTFQEEHELGTFCVSFVVDFVRQACESQPETLEVSEASGDSLSRVWLLSHHIYDKVKRKKLLELSCEKNLGGFTLPGKPGVICLEGDSESCTEAVAVIKSWNWQRIRVKFEEKAIKIRQFRGFEELSCYKATQGAGDRPHMDLGAFNKYLEDHNLKFAFKELFDVEAK